MRKFTVVSEVVEYESMDELTQEDVALLEMAFEAMQNAYAPYSRFKVGAAVALDNGETVIGNNQENVAYPSGLCAERVAMFAASAQHPEARITTVAVVATSQEYSTEEPIYEAQLEEIKFNEDGALLKNQHK